MDYKKRKYNSDLHNQWYKNKLNKKDEKYYKIFPRSLKRLSKKNKKINIKNHNNSLKKNNIEFCNIQIKRINTTKIFISKKNNNVLKNHLNIYWSKVNNSHYKKFTNSKNIIDIFFWKIFSFFEEGFKFNIFLFNFENYLSNYILKFFFNILNIKHNLFALFFYNNSYTFLKFRSLFFFLIKILLSLSIIFDIFYSNLEYFILNLNVNYFCFFIFLVFLINLFKKKYIY